MQLRLTTPHSPLPTPHPPLPTYHAPRTTRIRIWSCLPHDMTFSTAALASAGATAAAAAALILRREQPTRLNTERFAAATLETLLNAIDANDAETGAHVRRVATYALILGEAAGLDEHECKSVERVALFHDIGKIHEALFDIIHDHRKLNAAERRAIDTHPTRGAKVLAPLAGFYPDLAEGVLSHHERWDGTGYPRGLKGRRIPLSARIVAIADTFDAITHRRRYRERTLGSRSRRDIILDGRGTQFDPELVDLFVLPPVFAQSSPPRRKVDAGRCREAAPHRRRRGPRPRHHLPLASWAARRARAACVGSGEANRALITAMPLAPAAITAAAFVGRHAADRHGGKSAEPRELGEALDTDGASGIALLPVPNTGRSRRSRRRCGATPPVVIADGRADDQLARQRLRSAAGEMSSTPTCTPCAPAAIATSARSFTSSGTSGTARAVRERRPRAIAAFRPSAQLNHGRAAEHRGARARSSPSMPSRSESVIAISRSDAGSNRAPLPSATVRARCRRGSGNADAPGNDRTRRRRCGDGIPLAARLLHGGGVRGEKSFVNS